MKFEVFKPQNDLNYSSGWDKFALDYAHLGNQNPVYALSKELIYKIIEDNISLKKDSRVLDIGCGTGNDFPFFLKKEAKTIAFDRSPGMLNKAYEMYSNEIQSGQITLLKGRLEDFDSDTLSGEKFDLIFSVSGGLSYINNKQLTDFFAKLKSLLKPKGKIITGHFNQFCIAEFIYYILRLQFRSANQRKGDQIEVNIKNEKMTMHLRSAKQLNNIFCDYTGQIQFYPLLAFTPAYQTGYNPGKIVLNFHKRIEYFLLKSVFFVNTADQIIMVMGNE